MRTSSIRRALLAGAAALGLTLIGPLAAQADDAFRFWSYYQWDGDNWAFAPTGPADTRPADGDVEGWRFAV
ncbi:MAG TPA: hypothetical protein VK925_07820, partial [Jiangellaceae bacterium]|nr:hypothetical protein [Jiangellaceae bacterium]